MNARRPRLPTRRRRRSSSSIRPNSTKMVTRSVKSISTRNTQCTRSRTKSSLSRKGSLFVCPWTVAAGYCVLLPLSYRSRSRRPYSSPLADIQCDRGNLAIPHSSLLHVDQLHYSWHDIQGWRDRLPSQLKCRPRRPQAAHPRSPAAS